MSTYDELTGHINELRAECGKLSHRVFEQWYEQALEQAPAPTDWRALISAAFLKHGRIGRWLTGEELAELLPRCELEWLLPRLEEAGFLKRSAWSPSRSLRQWRNWPAGYEHADAQMLAAELKLDPVDAIIEARRRCPLGWVWELKK